MTDPDRTPEPSAEPSPGPAEPSPTHQGVREARIAIIVEMMATGRFVRGKTAKRLAAEWELSLDYVWLLTAEANKRVKAACTADAIFAEVVPTLRKVMRKASRQPATYKDANAAANHLADIYGLKQPRKHELTGAAGGPMTLDLNVDVRSLSDEQLRSLAGRPAAGAGGTGGAGAEAQGRSSGAAAGVHPSGDAEVVEPAASATTD